MPGHPKLNQGFSRRVFSHLLQGLFLSALAAMLLPGALFAQYSEDFESYTADEHIAGLGGWDTWDGVDDVGTDALVTDDLAFGGSKSLAIASTATDITDIVQTFSGEFTSGRWTMSVHVYVPSTVSGAGYFIVLNTYSAGAGTDKDWSSQVRFETSTDEVVSDGGTGFLVDGTLPLVYDAWVDLQLHIDLDANTQKIYYDGTFLAEGVWQFAGKNAIECVDLYANSISPEFYYDDLMIFADCNENGVDDAEDLASAASADCDEDGIPDECLPQGVMAGGSIVTETTDLAEAFGNVLALDGDVLVSGARYDDEEGLNCGAAYVYRYDGAAWDYEGKLVADDADEGDEFGFSVAVSGDWILVGARREDSAASNGGAAYFFKFDSSTGAWTQDQKVSGSTTTAADEFGNAVAISGSYAAVGAYLDDGSGTSSGAVYVFHYSGGDWSEVDLIQPSGLEGSDQLGRAVSMSGIRLYMSATGDDDAAGGAGAVYVYSLLDGAYVFDEKLTASDGGVLDSLGLALGSECGLLVAGAPLADDGTIVSKGAAYVYRVVGDTWTEDQIITRVDGAGGDQFGSSVAVSGDLLVIGASDAADNTGNAYVYRYDGFGWMEEVTLSNPEAGTDDEFGASCVTNGRLICVGSPQGTGAGGDEGEVFSYALLDCNGNGIPDNCDIDGGGSTDADGNGIPDECELSGGDEECSFTKVPSDPLFKRGDCDGNGTVSVLLDALFLLRWQFSGGDDPPCMDAADVNGNNAISALLDSLALLQWQFSAGAAPPSPGPTTCGPDPGSDTNVECDTPPAACL